MHMAWSSECTAKNLPKHGCYNQSWCRSTAVEVALKMAFRKFWRDHPDLDLHGSKGGRPLELKVVGIEGGYHGDTLGAMDAVAPSVYNGPEQFPW